MKTDGTIWTSGHGEDGELGIGIDGNYYSFVQVGTLSDWTDFGAGDYHVMALNSDNELWGWGGNWDGELGTDLYLNNESYLPIKSGGDASDWAHVFLGMERSFALKTDGTLWAFGYNSSGSLGFGDDYDRVFPFEHPLRGVAQISTGHDHTVFLKANGTLWSCGYSGEGRLGLGDMTYKTTPFKFIE